MAQLGHPESLSQLFLQFHSCSSVFCELSVWKQKDQHAGIYPGVSSVMAAHMCSIARKEYDANLNYTTPPAGVAPPAASDAVGCIQVLL